MDSYATVTVTTPTGQDTYTNAVLAGIDTTLTVVDGDGTAHSYAAADWLSVTVPVGGQA